MKRIVIVIYALLMFATAGAQVSFTGNALKAITIKPDAQTGLNNLYVLHDTEGVNMLYTASSGNVEVSRFGNLGAAYAQPVAASVNGNTYTVALGTDDAGYVITDGTKQTFVWIVNYANHECELSRLSIADDRDCERTRLDFDGRADKITYYTITGIGKELSRDLTIEYNTLRYDEDRRSYVTTEASVTLPSVDRSIGVSAPLCDTRFTLTADRFLREWGMPESIESPSYSTNAVDAHTQAEQTTRENENEQSVGDGALGGSAPAEITFTAEVTDAAIFREWQISTDPEFGDIYDRFQQLDFTYTFRDNGNFFVRFTANNAAGTCEFVSDAYEVMIGESALLCPNVFSPNGDGVNDEWKVSYKSIVEFECHIFDRWGQEMTSFTDPGRGWDGKYHGKYVPTGVYYYVIRAVGSDGRKYKLDGDINIIKSKTNTPTYQE